jgi:predicted RNA binding protein YcfA (HicA-like mRNA interferase family)
MKRLELIRHLESHGCSLLRDRGKHSVYVNPANNQVSAVPRDRVKSRKASNSVQCMQSTASAAWLFS